MVSNAADRGNYPVLLVAKLLMALIVLVINRLVSRRLYTLASTNFRLEASSEYCCERSADRLCRFRPISNCVP